MIPKRKDFFHFGLSRLVAGLNQFDGLRFLYDFTPIRTRGTARVTKCP